MCLLLPTFCITINIGHSAQCRKSSAESLSCSKQGLDVDFHHWVSERTIPIFSVTEQVSMKVFILERAWELGHHASF